MTASSSARRIRRPLLALGMAAVMGLGPRPAAEALPAGADSEVQVPMALDALLARALAENPDLQAARLRAEATWAKAGYARALEPPRLQASVMDIRSFGGPRVTISQMLPGGSKRALADASAQCEAEAADAEVRQLELDLRRDLRVSYYRLHYLKHAQRLNQQTLTQLRNLRKTADTRYAVGSAPQQDALQAQREISGLVSEGIALEAEISAVLARLNTLAKRPATAPVTVLRDFPEISGLSDAEALIAEAETRSPRLQAARARVEAQSARRKQAQEAKGTPDFEIGVEAGRSMPGDMAYVGGMVGVTLPWLSRGRFDGMLRESEVALSASEAVVQAERNRLRGEIHRVVADLQRLEQQLKLTRQGLLPQAKQALQASLSAYQVNQVDFAAVLDNQMALYRVQTEEARMQAEFHQAMAALEALVGAKAAP